jgi:hypothetical protein
MFTHPLDAVRVASPCEADWNAMPGDQQRRFCGDCGKHVYNLSAMTRPEAEQFLHEAAGTKCLRYFRRADGTILTQDCPEGMIVTATGVRVGTRFATLFGLVAGAAMLLARPEQAHAEEPPTVEMGKVAAPKPPKPPVKPVPKPQPKPVEPPGTMMGAPPPVAG